MVSSKGPTWWAEVLQKQENSPCGGDTRGQDWKERAWMTQASSCLKRRWPRKWSCKSERCLKNMASQNSSEGRECVKFSSFISSHYTHEDMWCSACVFQDLKLKVDGHSGWKKGREGGRLRSWNRGFSTNPLHLSSMCKALGQRYHGTQEGILSQRTACFQRLLWSSKRFYICIHTHTHARTHTHIYTLFWKFKMHIPMKEGLWAVVIVGNVLKNRKYPRCLQGFRTDHYQIKAVNS